MAHTWFIHDEHLGCALFFLDMLAEYTLLSMTVIREWTKAPGSESADRICPKKFPPKRGLWESYFLQGIIGKTHTQNLQILREDTLGDTCSAGPFCLLPSHGYSMSLVCSWNEVGMSYVQVSSSPFCKRPFWRMPKKHSDSSAPTDMCPKNLLRLFLRNNLARQKNSKDKKHLARIVLCLSSRRFSEGL